ncbi:Phox domain-containing protein [Rozella allomycis CSF55]|uniref:Phox domain-containing protein n=1 Tax=Rozella allomycis (strain CSF55) TaxID=988480 RepID=A0A075APL6_ROZAC|nr:Phox domain-containing protein [Rozella allomycis CSF55]|eukprot:EPZ32028.1 Phox domain-containing protein [Rozella allomycis CSF55]
MNSVDELQFNPFAELKDGANDISPIETCNDNLRLFVNDNPLEGRRMETPVEMSLEKTTFFDIKVSDPTNSEYYAIKESTVKRRYNEFFFLHNLLMSKYHGVFVPPIPEKSAIGRFQEDFLEARRLGLERCLKNFTRHPVLFRDPSLIAFLSMDSFEGVMKEAKKEDRTNKFDLIKTVNNILSTMSLSRHVGDNWFEEKRMQIERLESQFKGLLKALEAISKQRKEVGSSMASFGEAIISLSNVEIHRGLSDLMVAFGKTHQNLKEFQEDQTETLICVTSEFYRYISSINHAFNNRLKIFHSLTHFKDSLRKKKENLFKLRGGNKSKPEKIQQLEQQVEQDEKVEIEMEKELETIDQTIKQEMDYFDDVKIRDFRKAINEYFQKTLIVQRKVVNLWKSLKINDEKY